MHIDIQYADGSSEYMSTVKNQPSSFSDYLQDDSFIIMQATGLKDKNGEEIYEGDILLNEFTMNLPLCRLLNKIIGIVSIKNGMTYVIGEAYQYREVEDMEEKKYEELLLDPSSFEVVGDRYTNIGVLIDLIKKGGI